MSSCLFEFGGAKLSDPWNPELPVWAGWRCGIDLPYDEMLPSEAHFRDWHLLRIRTRDACRLRVELFILYDQTGGILHEWQTGYYPSLGELEYICQQLLKGEAHA